MSDFGEFLELPEDPELAFVAYERRLRREMWSKLDDHETSLSYEQDQKIYYLNKIMAFHDAHYLYFCLNRRY